MQKGNALLYFLLDFFENKFCKCFWEWAGNKKEMKYVLVTGGVVSGLGKGVTASSIGLLLQACDLRVTSIKIGSFFFFF